MDNGKFLSILRRYRLGEATEAEKALVEQWYELLDEGVDAQLPQDQEALSRRIWEKIESETGVDRVQEGPGKKSVLVGMAIRWSAAAVILLVVFMGWWFIRKPASDSRMPQAEKVMGASDRDLIAHTNDSDTSEHLTLADGTLVTLFPGSSIQYPSRFSIGRRDVFLKGEAFFDVARDPSNPFFVYSGGITTRVLGTSFRIKPLDGGDRMEVAVRTGKVEVFESEGVPGTDRQTPRKTMNGVVLTPNQRVIYHHNNGLFEAMVVAEPLPLLAEDIEGETVNGFVFSDAPLKSVLQTMEKAYGIEIIVENEGLYRCPFSGDISREDLFQKLDMINKALGTNYEVKGTRILIKGDGCE